MERVYIGGQAVIEGVMMKNKDKYAVAVRKPDQEIETKVEEYKALSERNGFCRLPIVRGVVNFIESLIIGMNTLTYASSFYEEEEESVGKKGGDGFILVISVILSLVLAIGLFILVPAWVSEMIGKNLENHVLVALIEGGIRLMIFLLYVWGIGLMKDMKRVYMYHGAEHKTINCLEAGEALTPENVMKHTRFHVRCGTSFLFIVMVLSILFFMVINVEFVWLRIILRILLVPVIAGIAYEIIRLAGKKDNWFFRFISAPGIWVQHMTTKEPDLDMVEVAIAAVEGVLDWKEYQREYNNHVEQEPLVEVSSADEEDFFAKKAREREAFKAKKVEVQTDYRDFAVAVDDLFDDDEIVPELEDYDETETEEAAPQNLEQEAEGEEIQEPITSQQPEEAIQEDIQEDIQEVQEVIPAEEELAVAEEESVPAPRTPEEQEEFEAMLLERGEIVLQLVVDLIANRQYDDLEEIVEIQNMSVENLEDRVEGYLKRNAYLYVDSYGTPVRVYGDNQQLVTEIYPDGTGIGLAYRFSTNGQLIMLSLQLELVFLEDGQMEAKLLHLAV